MNKSFVIPVVFATVILSFLVLKANAEELDIFRGVQYVSVSDSQVLSSSTMDISRDGGEFKDVSAKGDVLALLPGDDLVCSFKLPDNASNVKATVVYYVSSDSAKGMVRLNQVSLSDEKSLLKKKAQQGMTTAEILFKNAQIHNELKIFSVEGELCIHQIKIDYDYRMPSCKTDDVTVVLTSPVANTDVLQQNMRFEWKIKGARNGWITLKYQKQDNDAWETVPGAELLDCQATKKNDNYGEFFWNNHGLSAIPKIQIEYHDYNAELPKRFSREMRTYILDNISSADAFNNLVKRFLEEDKELAKMIVLKRHEISVFKPTKKTLKERELEHNIDLIPSLDDIFIKPFIYDMSREKKLKLDRRIAIRRHEDFKVDFGLLNLAEIEKGLNYFDILDKSAAVLEQHIQMRAAKEKSDEQIKKLTSIMLDIMKFHTEIKSDKKTFLSYSVVSPYLAAADRSLTWDYPNSESADANNQTIPGAEVLVNAANLTFPSHASVSYDTFLAIICYMNQNGWIKECNEDVQKQFTKLQDKYPIVKTRIKDNVTKEFVIEHDKKLQKCSEKLQGGSEK